MKERFAKAANKLAWTVLPNIGGRKSPSVEVLHQRNVVGEFAGLEYVHKCIGPAYIEPKYGYVITKEGQLLEASLTVNVSDFHPAWRQGMPSLLDFHKARRSDARIVRHEAVISLRHFWEWNYYHFYHDVLGKLHLLESMGLPRSLPLVLGGYALNTPFVQQILSRGEFANRAWIIQEDAYVLANTIYYCRTKENYRLRMDCILDQMDVPIPTDTGGERIYLIRGQKATRRVGNAEEVEAVARAHGFRIVDTDGMSIEAQIDLFAHTRYLLAAHGAGMTNIIYRRVAPLAVLELQPTTWTNFCFRTLAEDYGHAWDYIAGPPVDASRQHADYHIPPDELERKIMKMLTT